MDLIEQHFAAAPVLVVGWQALRLRFQPIVALADGRLLGLEALARLAGRDGAIIEPDDFVPQMEQAGLGALLADQVGEQAFADLAQAISGNPATASLHVAINLPLDTLLAPGRLAWLDATRARHGLTAGRILLELTESQRASDLGALCRAVEGLREAGYGVAIDDVVPDLPDLDALLDMPFSVAKFDKSLARATLSGGAISGFMDSVIAIARARGMTVIAEGIEDTESWVSLRDRGVTWGQGYWVSRPLPSGDLAGWIAGWALRCRQLP